MNFRRVVATIMFLSLVWSIGLAILPTDSSTIVSFNSDRWVCSGKNPVKKQHLGRDSLYLANDTYCYVKDAVFEDGTIEVDMAAPTTRSFMGIDFRFESPDDHESVYLRPHKSGLDDATQYMPVLNGGSTWQIFSGEGFTAPIDIPKEQWFHVKLEVSGSTGKLFVNNSEKPALIINDLKRGRSKGAVGLWAGITGGHFANFSYTSKNATEASNPIKAAAIDPRIIANWELSDAFSATDVNPDVLPGGMKTMKWQKVSVESPGMIVINRYRRSSDVLPPYVFDASKRLENIKEKKVVFAKTIIHSDYPQIKKLSFGYSDEVTVHLNRQPLFTGKSAFRFRDPGFLGIMDVEDDAVFLPLKKGPNELVLAVSEFFGGWGLICRLDDLRGLRLH
jgi:hypothetical protein